MLTRRDFCRLTGAAALGALVAPALLPHNLLAQGAGGLELVPLRDGAWAVTGGGGNSLVMQTAEGSILVDAKVFLMAEELREIIVGPAGAPTLLINTHHHGDHVGGNWVFRLNDAEVTVAAHEASQPRTARIYEMDVAPYLDHLAQDDESKENAERLRGLIKPDHFQADVTFADRLSIGRGDIMCELSHHGPGHTDNDAAVFVPELNILHVGDLIFHELHGYVDMDGGCDPLKWPEAIRSLKQFCDADTIVVPGHGGVTDRDGLEPMAEYFDQLREVVAKALAEGKTEDEIAELEPAFCEGLGFATVLPRALKGMTQALNRS